MSLEAFKATLSAACGWKPKDGVRCVKCEQPYGPANVRTEAERRETKISGLCGLCWDALFPEED